MPLTAVSTTMALPVQLPLPSSSSAAPLGADAGSLSLPSPTVMAQTPSGAGGWAGVRGGPGGGGGGGGVVQMCVDVEAGLPLPLEGMKAALGGRQVAAVAALPGTDALLAGSVRYSRALGVQL